MEHEIKLLLKKRYQQERYNSNVNKEGTGSSFVHVEPKREVNSHRVVTISDSDDNDNENNGTTTIAGD